MSYNHLSYRQMLALVYVKSCEVNIFSLNQSSHISEQHFYQYTTYEHSYEYPFLTYPTVPKHLERQLAQYTRSGLRVLALATRALDLPEFESLEVALAAPRSRLEQRLTFLGLVVLENRLKPDTAAVIVELRNANIRTLMVTGLLIEN